MQVVPVHLQLEEAAIQSLPVAIRLQDGPQYDPVQRQAASALQLSEVVCAKRQSMLQELPVHWHMAWLAQEAERET